MRPLRAILVVLIIGYVVYDFTNDADRDESGAIISEGDIGAFTIREGDCFNDSQEVIDSGSGSVELQEVAGLPCSEPHDNEVYAVFDISLESFPGDGSMIELAMGGCVERFESFVGKPYEESVLEVYPISPTEASWAQLDDREVICAVYHLEGEKLTGSMKDAGI